MSSSNLEEYQLLEKPVTTGVNSLWREMWHFPSMRLHTARARPSLNKLNWIQTEPVSQNKNRPTETSMDKSHSTKLKPKLTVLTSFRTSLVQSDLATKPGSEESYTVWSRQNHLVQAELVPLKSPQKLKCIPLKKVMFYFISQQPFDCVCSIMSQEVV